MSYLRSARPPSNAGRVHATIATLFEISVMLISRGPDGGAAKDGRSTDVPKIIFDLCYQCNYASLLHLEEHLLSQLQNDCYLS